jgi:hypothetical protein
MSTEDIVEEVSTKTDKIIGPILEAINLIPPYYLQRLTNLRHIVQAANAFTAKLDHELKVKSSTGAFDPEAPAKAALELEASQKKVKKTVDEKVKKDDK